MLIGPPAEVSPAKLFRLLSRAPRPVVPLAARFAFAPHLQLHCRALHPREWAEWEDDGHDIETVVLTHALCDDDGTPLLDRERVFLLSEAERSIFTAVIAALNIIGPSFARPPVLAINVDSWMATLRAGAAENPSILWSMGTIYEASEWRIVETPERFFGLPRHELLDGHWIAYRAARAVVEERWKALRR